MTDNTDREDDAWDLAEALYVLNTTTKSRDSLHSLSPVDDIFGSTLLSPASSSQSSFSTYEDVIPNFPKLSLDVRDKTEGQDIHFMRTSEPNDRGKIPANTEMSPDGFEEFLLSPIGLLRFQEWLNDMGQQGSRDLLRFWQDAKAYIQAADQFSALTKGLEGSYTAQLGASARPGFNQHILPALETGSMKIEAAAREALDKLYETEFRRFIAGIMTQQAKSRLGRTPQTQYPGSLAKVFCLVDPHLVDQPLTLVSDGFCELSEYPRERLIGRNCRFLQGPDTDQEAVRLLRAIDAIRQGKEHCSLLLNYTRTGKPFWNLFNLIPLRGSGGKIDFFLGAQVNVTKAMTDKKVFEALMGLRPDIAPFSHESSSEAISFSQDVLRQTDRHLLGPSIYHQPSKAAHPVPLETPHETNSSDKPSNDSSSSLQAKLKRLETSVSHSKSTPTSSSPVIPPLSGLPEVVRSHMEAFSLAYARLLIFNAKDRVVRYATVPLLSSLGYPSKTPFNRYNSDIIGIDFLDLIIGDGAAEMRSTREAILQTIRADQQQTLSASLRSRKTGMAKLRPSSADKANALKTLLHMTPLRDGQYVSRLWCVVVA